MLLAWVVGMGAATAQNYDEPARTVTVVPSGGDDTDALRAAFAWCVEVGAGCTVALEAGTYATRQLEVAGFEGAFVGAGMDATVIELITPLRIAPPRVDVAQGPADPLFGPVLLSFRDADLQMRDLGFRVTDPSPSETWRYAGTEIRALAVIVELIGRFARVDMERVALDAGEGVFYGTNVLNGIFVLLESDGDEPAPASRITFRDGRIVGASSGITVAGLENAVVQVRDSIVEAPDLGLEIVNVGTSLVELRGNRLRGESAAISVAVTEVLDGPTTWIVVDNTVIVDPSADAYGVRVEELPGRPTQRLLLERNTFDLDGAVAGVAGSVDGMVVRGNVFRGRARAGIRVGSSRTTPWLVYGNDLVALEAQDAAIVVTSSGRGAIVVCEAPTSVLDEGRDTLLACE